MKKNKISSKAVNYGPKRSTKMLLGLIYHNTGNDGDTDEANGKYFANSTVYASANEFIDDDSYTISVPANRVPYSVGKDFQDQKSVYAKEGRKYAGKLNNANTYNIEMCDTVRDGKISHSDATLTNAVARGRKILKKYPSIKYIGRHFDVTGKLCPLQMVTDKALWKMFVVAHKTKVTTTAQVRLRKKPNNAKENYAGKVPAGTVIPISKVKFHNQVAYGYWKKKKRWIALKKVK